jgi:tRNA-splicing endonuclease subunit Sen54
MHDALAHTRIHTTKGHIRAYYYGNESLRRDDVVPEEWRQGLADDHIVVVEVPKGPHFKSMGQSTTGKPTPTLWLLPEEALYLVERGNMDLWWPGRSSYTGVVEDEDEKATKEEDDEDDGFPLSLQAAYALLIGDDSAPGKVSLDRYTVYTNLKRTGYIVMREGELAPSKQSINHDSSFSIFSSIFGKLFSEKDIDHPHHGPLVKPGMYRSYDTIYRQIAVIPRHRPSAHPSNPAPAPEDPYRVVYLLWKASRMLKFAKTNPGEPDFRIAIVDARSNSIPTLTQITSLLESTPYDPPNPQLKGAGRVQVYQRVKHGWRNVVLAVVDQGVVSFLRIGEVAFGEEKLFENWDRGSAQGPKRGGGARRGRGRGRGRGRS